jgi:hypothetical protein
MSDTNEVLPEPARRPGNHFTWLYLQIDVLEHPVGVATSAFASIIAKPDMLEADCPVDVGDCVLGR